MTLETMKVIGTTPLRRDGIDKVTGAARFADDIHLPRMLHGKTLRSPYPHARIVSIDTSRALALPGVHKVVSGIDFPVLPPTIVPHGAISTVDMKDYADNCMAKGRVLYDGHVLAAVAADSPHIAEEAVRLIDVTYEQLEYVMDVQEAMAEGAPVIHEHFTPGAFIKQSKKTLPNAGQVQVALGDVDEGFDSADIIIEREFKTKNVHQGYIEPHSVTVTWGKNDQINVWTSTQGHFAIREHIAIILKHPLHKIKVTPMEIGGGFGGKDVAYLEPVAAVLSRETGRPVKMAMSRAEMLRGTGPSPATYIKVKLGAKRDGTLIAADLHLAYEAGAFPGGPVACAMLASTSRYRIPHVIVNGFDVLLNKPKMKQYRAPGGVPINFAVESCMDILAAEIEMSPLAFRLKNVMVEGDRMITDMPCQRIGGIEILETIQEHPHYTSNLCKPNQGRGLGFAFWFGASCHSSAIMTLNEDGTVQVATGNPDLSGTRMTLAMQAAEALGIEIQNVSATVADTDSIPFSFMSVGSRTTYATGVAVYNAAKKLLKAMAEKAALIWGVETERVIVESGIFYLDDDSGRSFDFHELAHKIACLGEALSVQESLTPKANGWQLAAHLIDVEVDVLTGKVEILRSTAFQDAGKAVHPDYVAGQMQGGAVQGIGWALNEEYVYTDQGNLANTSLLDYRMPTFLDLPMIETVILETPNPNHPYGVRGVGESSIMPPVSALANAINDAIGVRMQTLPMSPRAILEQIECQRGAMDKD